MHKQRAASWAKTGWTKVSFNLLPWRGERLPAGKCRQKGAVPANDGSKAPRKKYSLPP